MSRKPIVHTNTPQNKTAELFWPPCFHSPQALGCLVCRLCPPKPLFQSSLFVYPVTSFGSPLSSKAFPPSILGMILRTTFTGLYISGLTESIAYFVQDFGDSVIAVLVGPVNVRLALSNFTDAFDVEVVSPTSTPVALVAVLGTVYGATRQSRGGLR